MSRILRPAYGLSRSELHRAKESVRSLTTSQFFAAENDASKPPTNSSEQRAEKTSKEVNALLDKGPRRGGGFGNRGARGTGGNRGGFANRGGNGERGGASGGGMTRGKVVNLQSLPRRGRGGGGGLGIFRGMGRVGMAGGAPGRGNMRGKREGGSGGGGARGGRGGMRRRRDDGSNKDEEFASRKQNKGKKEDEVETFEEKQSRMAREVGVASRYEPNTTLGSLVPFLPDVATDSNPLGRLATAMANMRALTGGYVDPNPVIHAEDMYSEYRNKGSMFFTDLRTRAVIEKQGEVGKVDEEVKRTIIRRAILGEYEGVEVPETKDAPGVVRNALTKEATYEGGKVAAFEGKLAELVEKAKARQAKPAPKPAAKAPEGKAKKGKAKA